MLTGIKIVMDSFTVIIPALLSIDQGGESIRFENTYLFLPTARTVQISQPTRCNNFSSLLLDVYVQLNMFLASSRPSSGAQQLQ
jgi:hypothetical protein